MPYRGLCFRTGRDRRRTLAFLVLKPHSIGLTIMMQVSGECNVKGFPTPKEQMIYETGAMYQDPGYLSIPHGEQ